MNLNFTNFDWKDFRLSNLDFGEYNFIVKIGFIILCCLILLKIVDAFTPRGRARLVPRKNRRVLKRKRQIHRDVRRLGSTVSEMTPETFQVLRNTSYGGKGRKHISTENDFPGIYILLNHTRNMYYVGQGVRLFQRVNNHFTGHGNGDVYADYKYGDQFTIKLIPLENSGFRSLNELERCAIRDYGAYATGYNKTRGNRG